jgi:hypothetical protein
MGIFVYGMNVSLDLRIEQVPGDNGAGEWLRIEEELHRAWNDQAREAALMVQGRVLYEIMEEYWPRARHDESLPDYMREYAEIWTVAPKVLVSRTRTRPTAVLTSGELASRPRCCARACSTSSRSRPTPPTSASAVRSSTTTRCRST